MLGELARFYQVVGAEDGAGEGGGVGKAMAFEDQLVYPKQEGAGRNFLGKAALQSAKCLKIDTAFDLS